MSPNAALPISGTSTRDSSIQRTSSQSNNLNIVLVDDDAPFRESLRLNLVDEGFHVRDFSNGPAALDHIGDGENVDLVLLDWKMPEVSGLDVLKRLRQSHVDVPVIFLTALSDDIYEETALAGGAVDYVEKSRSFSILLKRIQLIEQGLKTQTLEVSATLDHGHARIWPESKRLEWKGTPVDLTVREFDIVAHLIERDGRDVTYRQIYDVVRGKGFIAGYGAEGHRANVRTIIKRIRQKFKGIDDNFEAIENFPGFGYRWRREG